MRTLTLALAIGAASLTAACTQNYDSPRYAGGSGYSQYDWDRPDPSYGGYYADRYYRDDNRRYSERRLSANDRVYVGQDGRYYCRRDDGTTGLIVGGIAGGTLGAIIAPGRSSVLGALIGGVAGAAAGQAIDKDNVRCR